MNALLEVRELQRHYRVRDGGGFWRPAQALRAVDGVSFELAAGRTLGLVGESGCGKSTTARLVLGLLAPTGGEVRFEGAPVSAQRDAGWRAMRRRMQMVYQDPLGALDRRLPVVDQVAEPLLVNGEARADGRREPVSLAQACEQARERMAEVGLTPQLFERFPHELSGGQRQRVVLARALILRPRLLVCDEPVSALDVSIQAQVINLLGDLQARHGVALLFISHDLKVVRQVSHEVAVMYLGRIVERGTPEALFRQPLHPYTQALVSAIPSHQRHAGARGRIVLQGDPPSPTQVPTGCAFHPRCAAASTRCRNERPALVPVAPGRLAACHLLTPQHAEGAPC